MIKSSVKVSKNQKHGMSRTRTYRIWHTMLQRCFNPNAHAYCHYGGRGIIACDKWRIFANFFSDMGVCPNNHTLDRINNSKGYYPENCKWSTYKEQLNNKRSNRLFTHNDVTMTATQWAETVGLTCRQLTRRIDRGWLFERALTTPIGSYKFKP